jgi:ubiquinone/menaquinone biosynthesis C-methylase UbiE
LSPHKNHLIVGDGNADLTSVILKKANPKSCHLLDVSPNMLKRANSKLPINKIIQFSEGTIQRFNDYQSIDFVHLPFVLDLLSDDEIEQLGKKWSTELPDEALIHIVDFNPKRNHLHQRILYFLFKLTAGVNRSHLPHFEHLLKSNWVPSEEINQGRFQATLWQKRSCKNQ